MSDETTIDGIPWTELKYKLKDPNFDKKGFLAKLDPDTKATLIKLAKLQKDQGDMGKLKDPAKIRAEQQVDRVKQTEAKIENLR